MKVGQGTLCLENQNTLTGANEVNAGILASGANTETPFGTGAVTIRGGATLAMPSALGLSIATRQHAQLIIGSGAVLHLTGTAKAILTIGGCWKGETPNISRLSAGTLTISLDAGVEQLGVTQFVTVQGEGGNLPAVTNGMVAPYIVGQNSDGSSCFLNYPSSSGFQAASTVSSADVGIASVATDEIYEVVNDQEITSGGNPAIAALEMNSGGTIGGEGTLNVGSQATGDCAGIVMNGGTITANSVSFGGAEGVIYTASGAPITISAAIAGSGGLTTFGPGVLILTADNTDTLSGPVNVAAGVLTAAGNGSATGSGDVVVNEAALLTVSGNVAGGVSVSHNGILLLEKGERSWEA